MNRKLRALGLALFAAFAMSAVAAQGASAVTHDFHSSSESGTTYLTAEHDEGAANTEQVFWDNENGADTINCTEVAVRNASITEDEDPENPGQTVNSVTAEPVYGNEELKCKAHQGETEVNARITTNGCKYTFHGETTEDVTGNQSAPVNLTCPPEKEITIDVTVFGFVCTHIPPQELEGAVYKNEPTEPETLTIEAKIHGIHSTTTENSACNEGTNTNGKYEGNVTVKGFEDEAHEKPVNITTTEP